ncbi:hypothetical protein F4054_01080 [Candidatus Poribacteria bacterium]|nr:hypothetical protein [Candidatus Poribacteria bacterium]MYG08329.1 hypothetical protein [Candidatus Poribacteria bacterium]MYK20834.1 hypothetical protein [Candidatus Poribacteria bacterium]
MIREALDNFQITPHLTENIMREIARIKPIAPSGGKPFIPWAIAVSTIAVRYSSLMRRPLLQRCGSLKMVGLSLVWVNQES